jgi:hypothetical protein
MKLYVVLNFDLQESRPQTNANVTFVRLKIVSLY